MPVDSTSCSSCPGFISEIVVTIIDYEIVSNAPHAAYLEYGTKSIDFKKTHPYGPRSRQGENGPYVIVPFRWGTPGTSSNPRVGFRNVMPKAVYAIAKKFDMSHVNSETYFTPNAFGQLVERYTHDWGGRLRAEQTGGDDTMTGMVRSEGYTWTKGGQREQSSGYLTFRIISAKKPPDWDKRPHKKSWENTWKKPEQAPRPITGTIAKVMEPEVSKIIEQGIAEDSPL
ncbi:hypothetical protein FACS1894172_21850 [Spirochaetia bacterium]|nr:hypothetical protein FACS1894172_21850 [Spirochaetia bacterium]